MNSFTAELPRFISVGGAAYAINTDFRIMADFEKKTADADISDKTAFAKILSETVSALFIDFPKADARQIVEGLLWYYRCGKESRGVQGSGSKKRFYDYDEDADYIYAAFMQQYGDDLLTSHMHWWEFRAKFMSLTDATEFVKIMQLRGIDISKIKCREERSRIKKIQERYALSSPQTRRFASLRDRDEAFKEKLRKRYDEVRIQAEEKNPHSE